MAIVIDFDTKKALGIEGNLTEIEKKITILQEQRIMLFRELQEINSFIKFQSKYPSQYKKYINNKNIFDEKMKQAVKLGMEIHEYSKISPDYYDDF